VSRGLGIVERAVLAELVADFDCHGDHGLSPSEITWRVAALAATIPSAALGASVRRAIGSLARKGLIERGCEHWQQGWHAVGIEHEAGDDPWTDMFREITADLANKGLAAIERNENRERLAKLLGMLGSNHEGERANAAAQIERLRKHLGVSWEDLLR